MTKKDDARKASASKTGTSAASGKRRDGDAQGANGGLTGKQALALWELILLGDAKVATKRVVELSHDDQEALARARLVTIEFGQRKDDRWYGSKLHLTDEAWAWANRQGFALSLSSTQGVVPVLKALLAKVGKYLSTHDLALDDLLRPRRGDSDPVEATPPATNGQAAPAPPAAAPLALEDRIRAAYLRVTGGVVNEYVKLALLRAQLGDEPAEAVDAELRKMQQRGGAVLYPIDDPLRLRPEDDAAALRVSGERRDLLCIRG